MPPPLSPGATNESKGQEGQCTIGRGGTRHKKMQYETAIVGWRRAQARHIKEVCVLPLLALLRMAEAAKADEPSELKNPTISAVGGCNSETVENPTMAHHRSVCATTSEVIEDGRGRGGRCSIRLENIKHYFLQCK